jgi:hypothetical protein
MLLAAENANRDLSSLVFWQNAMAIDPSIGFCNEPLLGS